MDVFIDNLTYALGSQTTSLEETVEAGKTLTGADGLKEAGFKLHHTCHQEHVGWRQTRVQQSSGFVQPRLPRRVHRCVGAEGQDALPSPKRHDRRLRGFATLLIASLVPFATVRSLENAVLVLKGAGEARRARDRNPAQRAHANRYVDQRSHSCLERLGCRTARLSMSDDLETSRRRLLHDRP